MFWRIALAYLALLSINVYAEDCLKYGNKSSPSCSAFLYDTVDVFFKDSQQLEQQVLAKRVFRKSDRQLLHVDYDFEVKCNNCAVGSTESMVDDVLWAWRQAYMENRFYTKEPDICDPTVQACCDDFSCNDIRAVEPSPGKGDIATLSRKGGTIDKYLDRTQKATAIVDDVMRISANASQLRQGVAEVAKEPAKFVFVTSDTGWKRICVIDEFECKLVQGNITINDNMADVDLRHQYGQNFNHELQDFLRDYLTNRKQMYCSQSMSCDSGGRCTIAMSCRVY